MSKHTPGPWFVKFRTNIFAKRNDVGYEGSVATTGGLESNQVDTGPENEANARLCAAAPDLLKACKAALDALGWHGPCESNNCKDCQRTGKKIEDAIAKAEVRS